MHDAFSCETTVVLGKNNISTIHAYSNKLLLVDSQFNLTHYLIPEYKARLRDENAAQEVIDDVKVLHTIKAFSRSKPVKLHAVKETQMLLVLADSYLSIYSIADLTLQQKLVSTKGATNFSVLSGVSHSSGIPVISTQVAVCLKRQVLLFSWQDSEFEGERHFETPDRGKAVEFLTDGKMVVALPNDFIIIDISSGSVEALEVGLGGPLGTVSTTMNYLGTRSPRPILTRTSDQMLLVKDVQSVFIDASGEATSTRSIAWATAPESVGYTYPYLVVVLKSRLEIRNSRSGSLLQIFDLAGIQTLNDGKSLFMATSNKVFRLNALPYEDQVEQLIQTDQLQEALSVLDILDSVLLENKTGQIRRTKALMAHTYFEEGKFDESMDLFGESWTLPSKVVCLLPQIHQPDTNDLVQADSRVNSTTGNDENDSDGTAPGTATPNEQKETQTVTERPDSAQPFSNAAYRSVSTFLARSRRLLMRFLTTPPPSDTETQFYTSWPECKPLSLEEMEVQLGIADTSLLRIYILISPGLVGSLVRLANRCDPAVVKEYLAKEDRWKELVDFYYSKGLHSQALSLLEQKGAVSVAIQYLQRLDASQWSVIAKYSPWLLRATSDVPLNRPATGDSSTQGTIVDDAPTSLVTSAMEIFTESSQESATFDRSTVATFLSSVDTTYGIQYLEYLIHVCMDTTPHYSEDLIYLYIKSERIAKLCDFLESESNSANVFRVFNHLPETPKFCEARAIALAIMGNLTKALEIYVREIGNPQKSEQFALRQYDKNNKSFEILLALYLTPTKEAESQVLHVDEALDLLTRHGPRLDADQVLSSLPPHTSLIAISDYLESRLRANLKQRISTLIESKLRESSLLRTQVELAIQEQKSVTVGVDRVCAVCHKRLGNSVLSVFPDGGCVHYGCQKRYKPAVPV